MLRSGGRVVSRAGADVDRRVQLNMGSAGVPETFIVDGQGMIRYKHIGPLTAEAIAGEMAREIDKARTPLAGNGS